MRIVDWGERERSVRSARAMEAVQPWRVDRRANRLPGQQVQ